jgi:hypothetical protein
MEIVETNENKMFSTSFHDFGEVEANSTHCVRLAYKGEHILTGGNFQATCGCTNVQYDANSKMLTACLLMNVTAGEKLATVICNIPEGQEIIQLKGFIK